MLLKTENNFMKKYSYILIICSIIGFLASLFLTLDIIKLSVNPNIDLPCNINPFISCKSVIDSWQGSLLGFPNPIIGLLYFPFLFLMGIFYFFDLLKIENEKITKKSLLVNLTNTGITLSMALVFWFYYQSVFIIGSLCLYCMIVWIVSWLPFTSMINNFIENKKNTLPLSKLETFISKNHILILILGYIIGVFIIIFKFSDYIFSISKSI